MSMSSEELPEPVASELELPAAGGDPWRALAWIGLFVLVALAFMCGPALGLTWDEPLQLRYGNRVLAWYRSGFQDARALSYAAPLFEYGGLFEAPAELVAWLLPFDAAATRHVLTALTGVLGVAGSWRIATDLGGTRAGFCAAALLAMTPVWSGHALFNSKDIPFAAAATWALYGALRLLRAPSLPTWRNVLFAGFATGAALGIRAGGMFLLAYPLLALAASARAYPARALLLRAAAVLGVAWLTMLSAWPWAQLDPLQRPLQVALHAANFAWGGDMLFRGEIVRAVDAPREYLPIWFGVTLPETYYFAWGCAVIGAWYAAGRFKLLSGTSTSTSTSTSTYALLAFAALGPLGAAIVLRPPLYDGQRHFLFLLPPLAAGTGLALSAFLGAVRVPGSLRAAGAAGMLALAALTVRDMLQLHPYEYVYFNRMAGGLAGASQRFETDYWGASYREGLAWIVAHVHPSGQRLRIASCACFHETKHYIDDIAHAGDRFEVVKDRAAANLVLVGIRRGCSTESGRTVHSVERQGVVLLRVISRGGT